MHHPTQLGWGLPMKRLVADSYFFYNRIAHVSDRNQLDSAALLGAVIAHELGHLLLPAGSHSTRGLMRAGWNRSDVLTADGLRFTAEQGVRIRARLEIADARVCVGGAQNIKRELVR